MSGQITDAYHELASYRSRKVTFFPAFRLTCRSAQAEHRHLRLVFLVRRRKELIV